MKTSTPGSAARASALRGLLLATGTAMSSGYQGSDVHELRHWDADSFGEPVGPVSVAAEGRYVAYLGRNEPSPHRIGHGPCGVFLWDRGKHNDPSTGSSEAIELIQDPTGRYVFQIDWDYYRIGMTPDGARMALMCSPPEGGYHIALVDLHPSGTEGPRVRAVTLASASREGKPLDGIFAYPSMSRDGRFVVFAGNPREFALPGQEDLTQVFLYDSERNGGRREDNLGLELISRGISGQAGSGHSGKLFFYEAAVISADGRWVAFLSNAPDLIEGDADDEGFDLFVADLESKERGGPTQGFRLAKAPRLVDASQRMVPMREPVCISPHGEFVACLAEGEFHRGNVAIQVYRVLDDVSGKLSLQPVGKPVTALGPQLADTFLIGKSGRGIDGLHLRVDRSMRIPESKISYLTLSGSQVYWLRSDAGTSLRMSDVAAFARMRLTALEEAALRKLLDGDHPVLETLRAQLAVCWVSDRYYTGVGFFTDLEVPPGTRIADVGFGVISDVVGEIEGLKHGAGFNLFITDGRLSMLEGFTYGDDDWPSVIGRFTLRYERDERDLKNLLQAPTRK